VLFDLRMQRGNFRGAALAALEWSRLLSAVAGGGGVGLHGERGAGGAAPAALERRAAHALAAAVCALSLLPPAQQVLPDPGAAAAGGGPGRPLTLASLRRELAVARARARLARAPGAPARADGRPAAPGDEVSTFQALVAARQLRAALELLEATHPPAGPVTSGLWPLARSLARALAAHAAELQSRRGAPRYAPGPPAGGGGGGGAAAPATPPRPPAGPDVGPRHAAKRPRVGDAVGAVFGLTPDIDVSLESPFPAAAANAEASAARAVSLRLGDVSLADPAADPGGGADIREAGVAWATLRRALGAYGPRVGRVSLLAEALDAALGAAPGLAPPPWLGSAGAGRGPAAGALGSALGRCYLARGRLADAAECVLRALEGGAQGGAASLESWTDWPLVDAVRAALAARGHAEGTVEWALHARLADAAEVGARRVLEDSRACKARAASAGRAGGAAGSPAG